MKKAMKKLTALTLIFMLLFSAFSVQASAGLFDKIIDVTITEEQVINIREVNSYIENTGEFPWFNEDYITLGLSCDVTITGGEVINIEDSYGESSNGKRWARAFIKVDINDYKASVEEGLSIVPYTYEVNLYSSVDVKMDYKGGSGIAKLVECYVKSITPVSVLPDSYREIGSVERLLKNEKPYDIEGAVFDIEYPDGRVVRDTVKLVSDEEGYGYHELAGEEIYFFYNPQESAVIIAYEDYEYTHPVEYIPFPIAGVVIDEVQVSDDFEPVSVTYTVTLSDETQQSFTFSFDGEPEFEMLGIKGYMAEAVNGIPVFVGSYKGYNDEYPATEIIETVVMADLDILDVMGVEGQTQEDNLLNRLIYRIRMFLMKIFEFLFYLY